MLVPAMMMVILMLAVVVLMVVAILSFASAVRGRVFFVIHFRLRIYLF